MLWRSQKKIGINCAFLGTPHNHCVRDNMITLSQSHTSLDKPPPAFTRYVVSGHQTLHTSPSLSQMTKCMATKHACLHAWQREHEFHQYPMAGNLTSVAQLCPITTMRWSMQVIRTTTHINPVAHGVCRHAIDVMPWNLPKQVKHGLHMVLMSSVLFSRSTNCYSVSDSPEQWCRALRSIRMAYGQLKIEWSIG